MMKSRAIIVSLWLGAVLFAPSAASPATVVVTSAADVVTSCATTGTGAIGTGGCTLRDAITFSNSNPPTPPAQNLIQFNIAGSGVQTITLSSDLPPITAGVVVDGYSQPGSSPNTLAVGDNAVLLIEIGGSANMSYELSVSGGAGSMIRGLVVHHLFDSTAFPFPFAIRLASCCNSVVGNFIGVDPTGTTSGNGQGQLLVSSSRNQIGGPAPADRNILSGGEIGVIDLQGDRNTIDGNYIGVNAAGTAGIGFGAPGFWVDGGSLNFIERNVISGNGDGVVLVSGTDNTLSDNFIGTDASGTAPVPNLRWGVEVHTSGNQIGSSLTNVFFAGNRIAFNGSTGVVMFGPLVNNSVLSNSIFSNGDLGIDLANDGVTPNDPCDADTGPNNLQNFPELSSATTSKTKTNIVGSLDSAPNTNYRIQLFSNSSCDPSGFGEGEALVGEVFATTDGSCHASFKIFVPLADAPVGRFITATATDPTGNTSEFSACMQVVSPPSSTRTRFLVEGPIRVAPGVPVEFPVRVEALREAGIAPSGEVLISDEAGQACRAVLDASGVGSCSLTFPNEGVFRVRADYEGNAEFEASTSPTLRVLVGKGGGGR